MQVSSKSPLWFQSRVCSCPAQLCLHTPYPLKPVFSLAMHKSMCIP